MEHLDLDRALPVVGEMNTVRLGNVDYQLRPAHELRMGDLVELEEIMADVSLLTKSQADVAQSLAVVRRLWELFVVYPTDEVDWGKLTVNQLEMLVDFLATGLRK